MIAFIIGMVWLGLILSILIMPVIFLFDEKRIKEIKELIKQYQTIDDADDEANVKVKVCICEAREKIISGYYKRKARDLIQLM